MRAERAGLAFVPWWVREMDDATAYMELVRANAQGELTALERGMHALHSGMTERAYAESVGRASASIHKEKAAAEVAVACFHVEANLSNYFRCLSEIHASPRWLWPALVSRMIADGWTVEATRKAVAGVKDAPEPPEWADMWRQSLQRLWRALWGAWRWRSSPVDQHLAPANICPDILDRWRME